MKHDFRKLNIWKDAINLATEMYLYTKTAFPADEKFGLISQINRAAVSVSSNIAEGAGRNHQKELIQFLGIAYGSLNELFSLLVISHNVSIIDKDKLIYFEEKIIVIQKGIFSFIKFLNNSK